MGRRRRVMDLSEEEHFRNLRDFSWEIDEEGGDRWQMQGALMMGWSIVIRYVIIITQRSNP
jgi:hypothetical protein